MKSNAVYTNFTNDVLEQKCWRIRVNGGQITLTRAIVLQGIVSLMALKAMGETHMSLPVENYKKSCIITLPIDEMERLLFTIQSQKHHNQVKALEKVIEDMKETMELEGISSDSISESEDISPNPTSIERRKEGEQESPGIPLMSVSALIGDDYRVLSDKLNLDDFDLPVFNTDNLVITDVTVGE